MRRRRTSLGPVQRVDMVQDGGAMRAVRTPAKAPADKENASPQYPSEVGGMFGELASDVAEMWTSFVGSLFGGSEDERPKDPAAERKRQKQLESALHSRMPSLWTSDSAGDLPDDMPRSSTSILHAAAAPAASKKAAKASSRVTIGSEVNLAAMMRGNSQLRVFPCRTGHQLVFGSRCVITVARKQGEVGVVLWGCRLTAISEVSCDASGKLQLVVRRSNPNFPPLRKSFTLVHSAHGHAISDLVSARSSSSSGPSGAAGSSGSSGGAAGSSGSAGAAGSAGTPARPSKVTASTSTGTSTSMGTSSSPITGTPLAVRTATPVATPVATRAVKTPSTATVAVQTTPPPEEEKQENEEEQSTTKRALFRDAAVGAAPAPADLVRVGAAAAAPAAADEAEELPSTPTPAPANPVAALMAARTQKGSPNPVAALMAARTARDSPVRRDVEPEPEPERAQPETQVPAKYTKMLQLGVPRPAVALKMRADGVADAVIAAFSAVPTPARTAEPAPAPAQTTPAQAAPAKPQELPPKYAKMLKMGVPRDAVALKMQADGVDAEVLAAFTGKPAATPAQAAPAQPQELPPKYAKMLKMGVPRDAVLLKMQADGVSVPTTTNNTNTPAKTRSNLRSLHWEPLSLNNVDGTVWARGGSALGAEHVEQLTSLFAKKQAKPKRKRGDAETKDTPRKRAAAAVQVISLERGTNVGIGLSKFRAAGGADAVVDAIARVDASALPADAVHVVVDMLPTDRELAAIRCASAEAQASFSPAEVFFHKLSLVPRFAAKVDVLKTLHELEAHAAATQAKVETVVRAAWQVRESDSLRQLLQLVLSVGNVMNEGTYAGDARGFSMASLSKLVETKAGDNKTTMLDFLAGMLNAEGEDGVAAVCTDLSDVVAARRLALSELQREAAALAADLRRAREEADAMGAAAAPAPLADFLERATPAVEQLTAAAADMAAQCRAMLGYLGSDPAAARWEPAAGMTFATLAKFVDDLSSSGRRGRSA